MPIWKQKKNFPNYMISNTGKVRSKERYTENNGGLQLRKGRLLKQEITKHGYNRVQLYVDGKPIRFSVHRLVMDLFNPNPNPKIYTQIDHINGIKTDNRVENLRWCTAKENTEFADELGLRDKHKKRISLTKDGIIKHFDSIKDAAEYIGCSQTGVGKVYGRKRKTIHGWSLYEED